jgi:hypothetical protein
LIGDQAFRSAFADGMLERLERRSGGGSVSLISPIAPPASGSSPSLGRPSSSLSDHGGGKIDPTTILLFATTAIDVSAEPRRAVEVLLSILPGRGGEYNPTVICWSISHYPLVLAAGIQEVLLLAALRLIPRLDQQANIMAARESVEAFSRRESLSRHMRRVRRDTSHPGY